MMEQEFKYRSYGKINLGLEIVGIRDDGYHEILTVFQSVRLHDTIAISSSGSLEVSCDDPSIPGGEKNIAYQAARVLEDKCSVKSGAKIEISKKIPSMAGMGGGSSNAAVTLIALNEIWNTGLEMNELAALGALIGADVPFFFTGGTALGSGRGEKIKQYDDLGEMEVLLAIPDFKISTAEAYRKADILLTTKDRANNILSFLKREKECSSLTNDFELFLFPEFPILEDIARSFSGLGALKTGVTGSGSVVFGLFRAGGSMEETIPSLVAKFPAVNFAATATLGRVEYQRTLRIT
jgi:4-diphosphocytidyl-2-C-methyl-D-erythritol kinase